MITPTDGHVFNSVEAQELAGITYRQLDHWARRGWVSPAVDPGVGRSGRRLYRVADIVHVAALAHFARSGLDLPTVAAALDTIDLPTAPGVVVVLRTGGPGDIVPAEGEPALVARADVADVTSRPGRWCVYDPSGLLARLTRPRTDLRAQEARSA